MKTDRFTNLLMAVLGVVLGVGIAWRQTPANQTNGAQNITNQSSPPVTPFSLLAAYEAKSPDAYRALLSNPRFPSRKVWLRWAKADPVQCYAELIKQPAWKQIEAAFSMRMSYGPPPPDEVIATLFMTWVELDPSTAFASLKAMPAYFYAHRAVSKVLSHLVERDPMVAIPFVGEFGPSANSFAVAKATWSNVDLPALAKAAERLPSNFYAECLLKLIAEKYAAEHPEDAYKWAQNLQSRGREALFAAVFKPWAESDPQTVMRLMFQARNPCERKAAAGPLATLLAKQDPAQAWSAAKQAGMLPDMEQNLIMGWATKTPAAAAQYFQEQEPEYRSKALPTIFNQWGARDVKSAAAAMEGLPFDTTKLTIIKDLVPRWAAVDPAAAGEFIAAQPYHKQNEDLARNISSLWARSAPAQAATWSQKLPEGIRSEALRAAYFAWARQDPTAAGASANAIEGSADRERALQAVNSVKGN